MLFSFKSKKGVHPVVAVSLLLVVSVIAVVGFAGWFSSFSNSVLVDVESDSENTNSQVSVEELIGNTLYFNAGVNSTIKSVSIGGVDCDINSSYSGLSKLDVSGCIENASGSAEIIVVTSDKVIESYEYIESSSLSFVSSGPVNSDFIFNDVVLVLNLSYDNLTNPNQTTTNNIYQNKIEIYNNYLWVLGTNLVTGPEGVYLRKFDYDMTELCSIEIGDSGSNANDFEFDNLGNIYLGASINSNLFVGKYDSDCNQINNISIDSGLSDYNLFLEFDSSWNIYIGGVFGGLQFIGKYDSNLNQIKNLTLTSLPGRVYDINLDLNDNLYVSGTYGVGAHVAKYNSSLDQKWNFTQGTNVNTFGFKSILIDSNNDLFVGGEYDGNPIIIKFNSTDGNPIMNVSIESGTNENINDIVFDNYGNILARSDFTSFYALSLLKYDSNLNHLENITLVNYQSSGSIFVDSFDRIYLTTDFQTYG